MLTTYMQSIPLPLTPPGQPPLGELQGMVLPPPIMDDVYVPLPFVAPTEPSVAIPDQEVAHQQLQPRSKSLCTIQTHHPNLLLLLTLSQFQANPRELRE